MKKFRKLFAAVIVLCLSFSAFSVNAENVKLNRYLTASVKSISQGDIPSYADVLSERSVSLNSTNQNLSICDYIAKELAAGAEKLKNASGTDIQNYYFDVSVYNKTTSEIASVFEETLNSHPDLFYVENSFGYSYNQESGIVGRIYPTYDSCVYNGSIDDKITFYNNELDTIIGLIPDNFTDLQKVLLVHDYITDICQYDVTVYTNANLAIYDAYNMLAERKGVCQAYTMLFMAVMQRIGIECTYASSKNANHIWNVVELDGEYYHIDLTFDDPLTYNPGNYSNPNARQLVNHDYFLLSTEKLLSKASDRFDWISPYLGAADICSTEYESGYCWENIKNPFLCVDGSLYGLTWNSGSMEIFKCSPDLKTRSETVATFSNARWQVKNSSGYWIGMFSGFSRMGNTFIVNTSDTIRYCSKINGEWKTGIIPCSNTGDGDYYDSHLNGNGQLELYAGLSPNAGSYEKYAVDIAYAVSNGSWAQALVQTRKSLLDVPQPEVNTDFLDMNGDNIIDIRDLVKMKKRSAAAAA